LAIDLPGIITAAQAEPLAGAGEVLALAFEDWQPPAPRGLEELRGGAEFVVWSEGAIIAAVRPTVRFPERDKHRGEIFRDKSTRFEK
jgi:hypothetical protein